jgi:hypothetical protein
MTTFNDEFYRDILEGLAIHAGSALQRDVLATISRHDEPAIGAALNKNQIASKLWLAESLRASAGAAFPRVLILGGWVGVLGAVLLHDPRFAIDSVLSIDIDPRCAPIAESLNATHVRAGRYAAQTADMLGFDYGGPGGDGGDGGDGRGNGTANGNGNGAFGTGGEGGGSGDRSGRSGANRSGRFDLIINTSCEHLEDFAGWYRLVPAGQLMVLQSNDYFACREHVNSVADLAAFCAQAPMREVLFAGQRAMRHYTRFMLIGRK